MTDYKKMYLTLFHATEEAINLLSLLPPPLPRKKRHGVRRDGGVVITPLTLTMISAKAWACHAFGE